MELPASDDVLAQPTRGRLFAALVDLHRPAGTEELAERLKLHPNGVRLHLERLREAGLVARERPRRARGRPRDMWSVAADARPGGEAPSAYAELGGWLARVISPNRTSLRSIEAAGREIGRELPAAGGQASGAERLQAAFASLGFQPHREAGPDGDVTYRLCNCPYRQAVRENQAVVCTLHRGITRGLLDVIQPDTELTGFVPKDPDVAGCLVELSQESPHDRSR
jgi:predicted ArsR family transcriptional regulator